MHFFIFLLFWLGCLAYPVQSFAQKDSANLFFTLPAEDVLNISPRKQEDLVSVASFQQTSLRNSPSAITLITKEEIEQFGARDFVDVLRSVAGLDFAQNFDMVVGLGVRGNWAEEGKALLMVDGQSLNEMAFGTIMFYMRIPVHDIERIEIMRGAGSALYGGLASLCVINVITQHKTTHNSAFITSQVGAGKGGLARWGIQGLLTQKLRSETSIALSASIAQGNMSNLLVNAPTDTPINYKDSSGVSAENIRFSLRSKALQATLLWNHYKYTAISEVVTANPQELRGTMQDILGGVTVPLKISPTWTLQPSVQWKTQRPWWYEGYQNLAGRATYDRYRTLHHRFTTGLLARYEPQKWWNMSVGSEFFWDYARYSLPRYTFYNQRNSLAFTNVAFFVENVISTDVVNVTVGGRADKNSAYRWAFSPRVALTKVWRGLHGKAMLNYAFKAPTLQNIQYGYNKNIRPELVRTVEFEMGYAWKEQFSLIANLFQTDIEGVITYVFNPSTLEEYYENRNRTGTRGVELEAKWHDKRWLCKANYAYYQNNRSEVQEYLVGEYEKVLAGFPAHKTTLQASYKIHKNLNASVTGWFFSEKFTYSYFGQGFTDFGLNRFAPTYSLNCTLAYKTALKGLDINLSAFNLTNQTLWFVSPVSSGVTPFPTQGREIVLRLAYSIDD